MISANDILGHRDEVKNHIASSEIEKALKRLIDFIRNYCPNMEDEVILLSMDYYDLEKELRMEIVSYENGKLTRRKIAFRMLNTLKSAMDGFDNQ